MLKSIKAGIVGIATMLLSTGAAIAGQIYFQGFETDNASWDTEAGTRTAVRVPSGTNGVTSSTGSFHAQAVGPVNGASDRGSAFTRWGGYGFTPGCGPPTLCPATFPASGFSTSLDIYLNVNGGASNDTRFDWDTAVNQSSGAFLRDFVFNAGFYNDSDATGTGNRFVISASNGATRAAAFPKNAARDPFAITSTGWYTFEERFYDSAGVLAVDFSIFDVADALLHSWTLSSGDPIAGVGGNRYGWVVSNEFSFLAIDNAVLTIADSRAAVPEPGTLGLLGLAFVTLLFCRRKRI